MKNKIKEVLQSIEDLQADTLLEEDMKRIIGGYGFTNRYENTYIGIGGDCRILCDVSGGGPGCGPNDFKYTWGSSCPV